jgi:hypothetical protein
VGIVYLMLKTKGFSRRVELDFSES